MGRSALKIHSFTTEEIKMMLRKDERFSVGVRLYSCYLVSLGKRPQEIAQLYAQSTKSIINWLHRFNEAGVEGLKDKPGRGRKCRLSEENLDKIKMLVLSESPESYGYQTGTWTGPLLADWIEKQWGVSYKKAQIYNLLKRMGLSYQKGLGLYPESANREEAITI